MPYFCLFAMNIICKIKKNLVLLWASHSEEKQRLKMTHLFFYLELKTKTQGHMTNNIYHYNIKVVFVNQDNKVNVVLT